MFIGLQEWIDIDPAHRSARLTQKDRLWEVTLIDGHNTLIRDENVKYRHASDYVIQNADDYEVAYNVLRDIQSTLDNLPRINGNLKTLITSSALRIVRELEEAIEEYLDGGRGLYGLELTIYKALEAIQNESA